MENCSLFFYVIYLIVYLDGLLQEPILGVYQKYTNIYILMLGIVIVYRILISRKLSIYRKVFVYLIYQSTFLMLYVVVGMMKTSNLQEIVWVSDFYIVIMLNVIIMSQFRIAKKMLIFSFFVPAVQAIYRFLLSEFQLNTITSVIGILSDNNRYRVDFGYNNVNTIGNLASGLIILSGLVVYVYNKEKNRCLLTIVCVCDIILLIEVLASGSRNALLSLLTYGGSFIILYLWFKGNLFIKQNKFIRLSIVLSIAFTSIIFGNVFIDYFSSSTRFRAFLINLPLLDKLSKVVFGLGIVPAGWFGARRTSFGNTYYVDNFYLYIVLELGVLGLILFCGYMIYIFNALKKNIIYSQYNTIGILGMSMFISQLVAGIGETSIMYYAFPMSFVFFITYAGIINGVENEVKYK